MEDGTITLVGATTENPSFELNGALLSRAIVLVFHRLDDAALEGLIGRAEAEEGRALPLNAEARETVKAMVVLKDGLAGSVTEGDILDWSRTQMAAYKIPRKVEFLPDVPEVPAPPMVLSDTAIRGLLKSLSAEQKAIQNKRGYLKLGELTAAQRKMLGNTSRGGDWNITFVVEGQKLSIRSN